MKSAIYLLLLDENFNNKYNKTIDGCTSKIGRPMKTKSSLKILLKLTLLTKNYTALEKPGTHFKNNQIL